MLNTPKVVAIVQARLGSTRLPEKVLADVCGKPMLWHVMRRVGAAKCLDKAILATVDNAINKPIVEFAKSYGFDCYAGSEIDLLDRFYQPCKSERANIVVRVTADCPLVDPIMIDDAVEKFIQQQGEIDYLYNNLSLKLPDGLDVEVFSMKTLEHLWTNTVDEFEREWFTAVFRDNATPWRVGGIDYKESHEDKRLTVDYPEDMELIRCVFRALDNEENIFSMEDILEYLKNNPDINAINDVYKEMTDEQAIAQARAESKAKAKAV